jgi:hypothetical protein
MVHLQDRPTSGLFDLRTTRSSGINAHLPAAAPFSPFILLSDGAAKLLSQTRTPYPTSRSLSLTGYRSKRRLWMIDVRHRNWRDLPVPTSSFLVLFSRNLSPTALQPSYGTTASTSCPALITPPCQPLHNFPHQLQNKSTAAAYPPGLA